MDKCLQQSMQDKKINFLIVLSTILVSGSLYYTSLLRNAFLIPLLLALTLLYATKSIDSDGSAYKIKKSKLYIVLLAAILAVTNINTEYSSLIVLLVCMVSAVLITTQIKFKEFSEIYINILMFLCISSWLYLPVLWFQVPSPLPDFISLVETPYSNFILFGIYRAEIATTIDGIYYVLRNSGIFWEPGAFQIFVNTAYYFAIVNRTLSSARFITLLITNVTIASSAGIFIFIILSIVQFLRLRLRRTTLENLRIVAISIVVIMALAEFELFGNTIDKFQEGSSSNVSYIARSSDFFIDFNILYENILSGVGYGNIAVREKYGIETMGSVLYWSGAKPPGADGLLLFLSYLGIFSIVIVWRLIYPRQIENWPLIQKLLVFIALMIMYNNQNIFAYLLPWVMTFYGFDAQYKKNSICGNTKSTKCIQNSNLNV